MNAGAGRHECRGQGPGGRGQTRSLTCREISIVESLGNPQVASMISAPVLVQREMESRRSQLTG